MKVTMKMNCLGREEEQCSSLRAEWAPAPAPGPARLVSPSCWAPGHISPQLEDILQQDTGKAIPLVVAVDVAASQEVTLKHDGLFLRTPPNPPPSPQPTAPIPLPAVPLLPGCTQKGYLGKEAVQVLDVVPGAWAQKGERWGMALT